MRDKYIPAFIMLIAATITSIMNILTKVDLSTGLKRLLLVIVLFYLIGLLVKLILNRILSEKEDPKKTEVAEQAEETQERADDENTGKEDEAKKK